MVKKPPVLAGKNQHPENPNPEKAEGSPQCKKLALWASFCFLLFHKTRMKIHESNKSDFHEVQRRSLMSNLFKINLAAKKQPVSFAT